MSAHVAARCIMRTSKPASELEAGTFEALGVGVDEE